MWTPCPDHRKVTDTIQNQRAGATATVGCCHPVSNAEPGTCWKSFLWVLGSSSRSLAQSQKPPLLGICVLGSCSWTFSPRHLVLFAPQTSLQVPQCPPLSHSSVPSRYCSFCQTQPFPTYRLYLQVSVQKLPLLGDFVNSPGWLRGNSSAVLVVFIQLN